MTFYLSESVRGWLYRRARRVMATRLPDNVIWDSEGPYLSRWKLLRSRRLSRFGNVFVHRFHKGDDDRALHDHPWSSCSIVLTHGYVEHLPGGRVVERAPGAVVPRRASQPHRVELIEGRNAVTIFLHGPRTREWGFHCPAGWRHWRDFVGGRGCDG